MEHDSIGKLMKTIDCLVGKSQLRRIDSRLIDVIQIKINSLDYEKVIQFINGPHESLIVYILFDEFNPVIKFKQNIYMYKNENDLYLSLTFEEISLFLFRQLENVLKTYMRKCVRCNKDNDLFRTTFESNYRLFLKNKDILLKKVLHEYT